MDGGSDQNYPKEIKKTKWLSDQALQLFEKRREAKGKTERELSAEFHGIARRDKKAFLSEQRKEIDENNRMGTTRVPGKHFIQKQAQQRTEMARTIREAEEIKKRWQGFTE